MSLKLRRGLITILLAFVLVFASLATFVAPMFPITVNAEVIEAQVEGVDDNYILNVKQKFPASISSPASASDGVIIYPNGKAYKIDENKEYNLNVAGEYTLRYFADSQVYEKIFLVSQKNFLLSVEQEIAGKNEIVCATTEIMEGQTLPNGTNFPNRSDWPNISQNLTTFGNEALIVRMESGTKFTYSTPIDLSKAGEDGLTNIIKFHPRWGDYDKSKPNSSANYIMQRVAREMHVTLTDCYDSSRYLRFIILEGGDTNYARAGTDNLLDAGWVFPASKKVTSDMNAREFYEGTQYGYAYLGSYGLGSPAGNLNEWVRRDGFYLKYDYEGHSAWVTSCATNGTSDYQEAMINDFDQQTLYPSQAYRGFTTGEVYLTVEFSDYQSDGAARVDIYEIAGIKAEELIAMREQDEAGEISKFYKDTTAPVINVDFKETTSDGVFVDVGTEFVVPEAKFYDINLKNSKVSAYRNYDDLAHRTNVPIIDGKLKVTEEDTYVISYYGEDSYGNVAEKLIKVFGVDDKENPSILFDCGTKVADINAGAVYTLPAFTFETVNNLADRKVKVTISSDRETLTILDLKNGQEIEEFLANGCEFSVNYSGEYTIKYEYSDNAVAGTESYKITSNASDAISFPVKPVLPRYLIKDATYDFDEVYAYNYITGEQAPYKKADIYIAYDENVNEANVADSTFTKLDSAFSNKITGSEKAVLKYVYESTVAYTDVAKIVDTNITKVSKLQQYRYFVGDFATGHPDDVTYDATLFDPAIYYPEVNGKNIFDASKLDYKAKATSGNAKLEFINVVDISNFSFYYRIIDDADPRVDADNYNALRLVFTDVKDASNQVYVRLYKLGDLIYVDVNGQAMQNVQQIFSGNVDKSITYNLSTGLFSISGVTAKIPFAFDFTKAYLDIIVEDISGTAGIRVMELNGHKFSHDGNARSLPISLMTIPQGNYKAGTVITINPAEFIDVLSPIIKEKVSIKITDPSGAVMTALDGTALDGKCDPYKTYQIRLNDLGQYKVSYSATSGINQRSNPPGFLFVTDLVAPEITFEGGIYEGCVLYLKPGQKYELKYSVKDDVSLPENIFSRIIWQNKKLSSAMLLDDNVLSFVEEGTYEVGVSSFDEEGNFARKTFTVIVTKEEVK